MQSWYSVQRSVLCLILYPVLSAYTDCLALTWILLCLAIVTLSNYGLYKNLVSSFANIVIKYCTRTLLSSSILLLFWYMLPNKHKATHLFSSVQPSIDHVRLSGSLVSIRYQVPVHDDQYNAVGCRLQTEALQCIPPQMCHEWLMSSSFLGSAKYSFGFW